MFSIEQSVHIFKSNYICTRRVKPVSDQCINVYTIMQLLTGKIASLLSQMGYFQVVEFVPWFLPCASWANFQVHKICILVSHRASWANFQVRQIRILVLTAAAIIAVLNNQIK